MRRKGEETKRGRVGGEGKRRGRGENLINLLAWAIGTRTFFENGLKVC